MQYSTVAIFSFAVVAVYCEPVTIASLSARCNTKICETCIYDKCTQYPAGNFTASISCRGRQCVTCLNDLPCQTSGSSRGGSVIDINTVPDNLRRRPVSFSPVLNDYVISKPLAGALQSNSLTSSTQCSNGICRSCINGVCQVTKSGADDLTSMNGLHQKPSLSSYSSGEHISSSQVQCQNGICRTCVDGLCRISHSSRSTSSGVECYNGVCADVQQTSDSDQGQTHLDTFPPPIISRQPTEINRVIDTASLFRNRGQTNQSPVGSSTSSSTYTSCQNGICRSCINDRCVVVPNSAVRNPTTSFSRSFSNSSPGFRSSSTALGFQGSASNAAATATSLASAALKQQIDSLLANPYCVSSSYCATTHICVKSRCIVNPNGRRHIEFKLCTTGFQTIPTGCPNGFECQDSACFEPLGPVRAPARRQVLAPVQRIDTLPIVKCRYPFQCGTAGLCVDNYCVRGPNHGGSPCGDDDECPNNTVCRQYTCFERHVAEKLFGA